MITLGVDPSVNNIGIALYDDFSRILKTATFHPNRAIDITMPRVGVQIARYIIVVFLQGEKRPDQLVIEYPEWQGSERGLIAMQKGYTLDLAFVVGYLCGSLGIAASKCFTPTPTIWKGNQPKKATELRVQKQFGILKITEHEYDAVGMVQWLLKQQAPPSKR